MSNNLGEIYGTVKDGRSCITIDSSSVDVTGNLITKGIDLFMSNEYLVTADPNGILNRFNNVVNIPATDSCGNDLAANTTYEITTGPTGNINNISFVKKQPEYILSAAKNGNQDLANSQFIAITNWTVLAQKNSGTDFNTTSGVWTCPASGLYEVYFDGHFIDDDQDRIQRIIIQIMSGTNVIKQKQIRFQSGNLNEDAEKLCLDMCTIRNILQGDEISFLAHLTVSGSNNTGQCAGSNNSYTRTEIYIQRVG